MSNDSCGGNWHIFAFMFVDFKRVILSSDVPSGSVTSRRDELT